MIVVNKKNLYASLLAFLLSFVVVFRLLGEGPDFANYREIFFWFQTAEPFWYIISILNRIIGSYFITLFLITFFSLYSKFNYFGYVDNKLFYLFLIFCYTITFFFLHEYTQIRISLVIGLFVLYAPQIKKMNLAKYFFFICVLTCIHYSAIIFIPLYFFIKIKGYRKYVVLPLMLFIFDIFFLNYFREQDFFNRFIDLFFSGRFAFWGDLLKRKGGGHQESLTLFNKLYLLYLFVLIQTYYFCFYKNNINDDRQIFSYKCLSYTLCLFYICIYAPYPIMTLRFTEIFLPFSLPILFFNLRLIKEKFLYFVFILFFIVLVSLKLISVTGVVLE